MQPDEQNPKPVHLAVGAAPDGIVKALLALVAVLLLLILWRGVPVHLRVSGWNSDAVYATVRGINPPSTGTYEMEIVSLPSGRVYVTRMNKHQGTLEVFFLDDQGKLHPMDQQ